MGLENILKKIRDEAAKEAERIIQEAKDKVHGINCAREERLRAMEEDVRKQEAAIDLEVRNAYLLPAKLEVKGAELESKRDIVNRAIREAMSFSCAEYEKVLDYFFKGVGEVRGGVLHPAAGMEKLTEEYLKKKNLALKMGDPIPISGGFIIKAGKIEYDCSFDTLIKRIKEKIELGIAMELE